MKIIKTILADDHRIVLQGLKEILSGHENIEVVGQVTNGREVLDFIDKNNEVDMVVLDINMPEMDGITCARKLKSTHPKIKIIILTMYAQRSFVEEIVKIGIDGCLLKNNTGNELVEAVIRIMDGKPYYDQIKEFTSNEDEIARYKLSKREIEIIKLLCEGATSTEIAERLFISEHTVRTHRKNILKKTDSTNTSKLVQFAMNNQIL